MKASARNADRAMNAANAVWDILTIADMLSVSRWLFNWLKLRSAGAYCRTTAGDVDYGDELVSKSKVR